MAQGSEGVRAVLVHLGHFKLYVFAYVQPNPVTTKGRVNYPLVIKFSGKGEKTTPYIFHKA